MRPRLISLSGYGIGWSAKRRMALMVLILACLLAIAGVTAYLTQPDGTPRSSSRPAPIVPTHPAPSHSPQLPATESVDKPPDVSEPVQFAQAAAQMLWTYDTRTASQAQQLAGMKAWMTDETEYSDWESVAAQVPDPTLWSQMADQKQRAAATVTEAHYPAAFQQALADDPQAITEAYIYAVTVTGKQRITWADGGSGAEGRSITLAVQCRPSRDCSLVAIAPYTAP
ncbi:hypothetical protein [Streptomyces sp. NPDC001508]|uniref:hypothetical protein n=1 Tax=Streptomyces sp. NPDC001508 TaxID=3154656 RepID=UPI003319DF36